MAETTARTLALLNLLQTHRQWSGPDLAMRLEITERTLRRDIERLRELGYRVEAERGPAGGYRLEAGAALPPLLLTDEEAVAMAIGLRMSAGQGLDDGEHVSLSALAKLEQVLPAPLRARVSALASVVEVTPGGSDPVAADRLGLLALACRDRERLRFSYRSGADEPSERVVEPHSLVTSNRRWFLVCWDRDRANWRTFRVDRMSRIFPTRVHFDPRPLPAPSAAEFVRSGLAGFRETHTAAVILSLPIAEMRARFGRYGDAAVALDQQHTRWPIQGDTLETMFASIAWIPAGVEYRLEGSAQFLDFAREASARLARAV
jgi:predicted DNA-binding transcriptional regulator YafY